MILADMKPPEKIRRCKVRTVKDHLEDQKDVDLLETYVMDSQNWSTTNLSNALASRGVFLSPNTIMKHRNKACSCWTI